MFQITRTTTDSAKHNDSFIQYQLNMFRPKHVELILNELLCLTESVVILVSDGPATSVSFREGQSPFYPEDAGNRFLRQVCIYLPSYTASSRNSSKTMMSKIISLEFLHTISCHNRVGYPAPTVLQEACTPHWVLCYAQHSVSHTN